MSDGSLGTDLHTKRAGGFEAKRKDVLNVLYENFFAKGMTEEQMLELVHAMERQEHALQSIAMEVRCRQSSKSP